MTLASDCQIHRQGFKKDECSLINLEITQGLLILSFVTFYVTQE